MNKTEILVTGSDKERIAAIIELINENDEWYGIGASTGEEAIEKFHQGNIVIVLLSGINEADEKKLRKIFTYQNADVVIKQYNEGDNQPVTRVINEALGTYRHLKKPSVSFTDNAFVLNIDIQ
jgi:hypothetical protein